MCAHRPPSLLAQLAARVNNRNASLCHPLTQPPTRCPAPACAARQRALHLACDKDNVEFVRELLAAGADADEHDLRVSLRGGGVLCQSITCGWKRVWGDGGGVREKGWNAGQK